MLSIRVGLNHNTKNLHHSCILFVDIVAFMCYIKVMSKGFGALLTFTT